MITQQVRVQLGSLFSRDGDPQYLVSLVLAVLLAHAAHEGPRLTRLLQADELDGVDLVLRAQGLLVRLVGQRHPSVFGQRARGVGELRAVGAQVGGAHGAVHGGRVALVLVAADDALEGTETQRRRLWDSSSTG